MLEQRISKIVQVEEGVEVEVRLALARAHAVGKGHIEPEFGVGEGRHKHWNILLERRFENTPASGVTFEVLANSPIELP